MKQLKYPAKINMKPLASSNAKSNQPTNQHSLHAKRQVNSRKHHIFPTKSSDDDDEFKKELYLGFFADTQQQTCITVPIDGNIEAPMFYRQVVNAINNTSEQDVIEFEINSGGGRLDGLCSLLSAMKRTSAEKIALINGDCHSAASMLALACDAAVVSPYASMLVHNASGGTLGKIADMRGQLEHLNNFTDELFRDTYKLFLSEEEIEDCLGGKELWLNASQIIERLQHRQKICQEQAEAEQEDDEQEYLTDGEKEDSCTSSCGKCCDCDEAECCGDNEECNGSCGSGIGVYPKEVPDYLIPAKPLPKPNKTKPKKKAT